MTTQHVSEPTSPASFSVGLIVRAVGADDLAVGIVAHYGGPDDTCPGVPYVRPLRGGELWQAVVEDLRPATSEEIAEALR